FDGDGKIDTVVASLEGPAELWRNVSLDSNHWLTLKLTGTHSNHDGIGAHARIGNQYNDMTSAVSYASSTLDGVHFGLGRMSVVERIDIVWPSGVHQTLRNIKADQMLNVQEPR